MGYVKPNCHEKTGEFFWEPRMIHHNSPSHFPGFGDFPGHHIPTFPMTPYLQKSCLSHLLVAICHDNMEVAWNRGTPTSSIWGYPHLWKPQLVAYAFWIDTQDTVHNLQHEPYMNHTWTILTIVHTIWKISLNGHCEVPKPDQPKTCLNPKHPGHPKPCGFLQRPRRYLHKTIESYKVGPPRSLDR